MKLFYKDYAHPRFRDFSGDWPRGTPIAGGALNGEDDTLAFLDAINDLLRGNEGYGTVHNPQYEALGALNGYAHVRYYDPADGKEYSAMSVSGRPMTAVDIVEGAFIGMGYSVRNRRAVRALRVREGSVLHVIVDAHVVPWEILPDPDPRTFFRSLEAVEA